MSSSKIISGDAPTTSAYQRWELPTMQSPHGPKGRIEDVAGGVKPLTAEELEQIQKEAYREGYELGRKEGRQAGQKDIKQAVANLARVIDAFTDPLQEVDAAVEQELVSLALAIAKQIIRRELKTDPGQVVGVVREALAALPSASRRVQIVLHPEDAQLVREALLSGAGEETHWHISEDPLLTRGGCRISAEHSQIDATVEQRIAAISNQLLGGERKVDNPAGEDDAR